MYSWSPWKRTNSVRKRAFAYLFICYDVCNDTYISNFNFIKYVGDMFAQKTHKNKKRKRIWCFFPFWTFLKCPKRKKYLNDFLKKVHFFILLQYSNKTQNSYVLFSLQAFFPALKCRFWRLFATFMLPFRG